MTLQRFDVSVAVHSEHDGQFVDADVAQELYDALEEMLSYTRSCEDLLNASQSGQCLKARDALAKARGEDAG